MKETLGKRIAENRKRLGLTQEKLAEQLGVTAQAVSKWEHDQSCPDIIMLPKLAELFGMTTDDLLGIRNSSEEKVYAAEVVEPAGQQDGIHIDKNGLEFHWDSGRRGHAVFAIWVLLVGGLLLASRLMDWSIGLWDILWTTGLILFPGASIIRSFSVFNLVCVLTGGYFLLDKLDILPFTLGSNLLLPLAVILFGVSLLLEAIRKPKKPKFTLVHNGHSAAGKSRFNCGEDSFDCTTSFGSDDRYIQLPLLRSGEAAVSFGELELDLSGCQAVAENCHLDVQCSFGELSILVPRRFRVDLSNSTAFAGVDVDGEPDPNPQGIISINGSVSFGEISIEYI